MSLASRKLIQATAADAADTGDGDFANVVLLLDGDGTSGDDNNTFTDSSPNGFTVTESGSVVQGSFSPYGDNWSNYFDGSGDYLTFADDASFNLGAGDFTVECWAYFNSSVDQYFFGQIQNSVSNRSFQLALISSKLYFEVRSGTTAYTITAASNVVLNQWTHLAAVRNGNTITLYQDGASIGTVDVTGVTINNSSNSMGVGSGGGYVAAPMNGYLSNARLVVGTAVYTSAFTPPTAPLTAISGTSLLTCQSNTFVDESTNNHAVTVNGTPKVTPFSPFRNDEARDITVDGGSANFDSNEYLTIADNSALDVSGAMTAEAWIYVTDMPDNNIGVTGQGFVISRWTASGNQRSWMFVLGNNGDIAFYSSTNGGVSYIISTATGAIGTYRWIHVAASWDGTNQRIFIDGDLKATTANASGPFSTASSGFTVNAINTSLTGTNMNMYVGDARYFPDVAIYTSSFTPPTAPLGNLAGSANSLTYGVYSGKSFSVSSQESNPQGVRFKSDGTKMYVIGNTGDGVGQYSLSTAWDVSTASFDSVTLDVSSEDSVPNGLVFSSDGTKLYITGNTNNKIFQYDLSTAWDLSTASYANKSLLTSTDAGTGPIEPFMRSNGTDFYYLDLDAGRVYQYTLSTANDISTASYASKSFSVTSQETVPTGLTFSSDGTKMFVCGQTGDDINQYTLSTAWDVSTASSVDILVFDSSAQAVDPAGIDLKPDGSALYMISNSGDAVYQYTLTDIPPQVLLNFQDAGIYDLTGINNLDTVGNAQIDTAVKKYGTGSIEFDETGDYLAVPPTDDIILGTGDFTIEGWLYIGTNPVGNGQGMFQISNGYLNSAVRGPAAGVNNGNGKWAIYYGTSQQTATAAAPSINTWYHVAYVRNSSTTKLYIDGTELISVSDSTNYSDTYLTIGGWYSASYLLNGFIDDFRITKGIARYTSSFTPPDAALPKF